MPDIGIGVGRHNMSAKSPSALAETLTTSDRIPSSFMAVRKLFADLNVPPELASKRTPT
jgi:hypothetical protein